MAPIKQWLLAVSIVVASAAKAAVPVSIVIDTGKPGPVINKNIYGQFAEHLGTGVYEGMWVGPDSPIPNTRGWRNDVVGALKDLQVPLVRWPGGCFAEEYHWREGIGPRALRPVKVTSNWGSVVTETNAVGTHEFFDLIDQLGAEAYVNGNLGTGTPQEMSEWVEYLTADGASTLAQLRRKNGHEQPFKVAYFAIGNESWGCGGHMTPQYFAEHYRQFATFLKPPAQTRPLFLAAGGEEDDTRMTDYLTKHIHADGSMYFDAISFHFYTRPSGKWETRGPSTGFKEDQWFATLKQTLRIDKMITNNVAVMDKNDPQKKLGFNIDEWGTWYDVEPGSNPGYLYQQNTLRDALVAALNLNIFHAHAERVRMTNIAQMVNVLQAMILTDKEQMLLTPTYHTFKMYIPFQGATALPLAIRHNRRYTFGKAAIAALSASAARGTDGKLYLSLVNADPNQAIDVDLATSGGQLAAVAGSLLTAGAMDARNTFEQPQAIAPVPFAARANGTSMRISVPAKSVMVLALQP